MTIFERMEEKRKEIAAKLAQIKVIENKSEIYVQVAANLNVTAPTIRNYLRGHITDGYLAEAIFAEFKKLKLAK